jgi:hypothetical protein
MDLALFAAASGMAAQQRNLDTIADNLANAGVVGFKGSAQGFAELIAPGGRGVGTVALGSRVLFAQGKLARSAGPFDLAIDGPGFFTVCHTTIRAGLRTPLPCRSGRGSLSPNCGPLSSECSRFGIIESVRLWLATAAFKSIRAVAIESRNLPPFPPRGGGARECALAARPSAPRIGSRKFCTPR